MHHNSYSCIQLMSARHLLGGLHRLLPHAPLEWIEQAGHQTPLEQPAVVARHLLALIDRATPSPQP